MLTIFSAPKPFEGAIDVIQRNALRSWLATGMQVQVLLVGEEAGLPEVARAFGVLQLPGVQRNTRGTPLVSSIFQLARQQAKYPILCYVNADILLLPDLIPTVDLVANAFGRYLVVGQRWDLRVARELVAWPEDGEALRAELAAAGKLHPPGGSDYFIFPRNDFEAVPPFALGRAGWDNWMIFAARAERAPVVDATGSITAIHQDHDYAHLPDGQPHYRLPESDQNVALAGGREMIFTLRDATWRIEPAGLRRIGWMERGLARSLESGLYLRLGPGRGSRLVRRLFHPLASARYYAGRIHQAVRRRLLRIRGSMAGGPG